MGFKQTIPDRAALHHHLIAAWGNFDTEVKAAVGSLEADYKRMRKRRQVGVPLLIGAAVFFGAVVSYVDSESSMNGPLAEILGILLLPVIMVCGYLGFRLMRDKDNVIGRFNKGVDGVVFPKVLAVFGLTGNLIAPTYAPNAVSDEATETFWRRQLNLSHQYLLTPNDQARQVMDLLDHSELVTEPRNRAMVDNMVSIDWHGRPLFVAELDLKHVTGSGKNRSTKHIFSGYFVSLDLERHLTGKTFVSTEGDTKGFGHQSFWKNLTGREVKVTELEWNDFENLLHVATTDPTEARYILTTDFMSDLYDWWKGQAESKKKRGNIRISFIGSRMYVLFPDKHIRFSNTVSSISTQELQEYTMTIADPLLHVVHLAEDVRV